MRRKYFGDSYDAVKRIWQDIFTNWVTLYAEPRFIPEDLRAEFTRLRSIPMLPDKATGAFSILNDPDTGIRLPGEKNQSEGCTSHIAINSIVHQLQNGAKCVITFDQSVYRKHIMNRQEQRKTKMSSLVENGMYSFYYVSHAPFLFAMPDNTAFLRMQALLKNAGIPEARIETIDNMPNQLVGGFSPLG